MYLTLYLKNIKKKIKNALDRIHFQSNVPQSIRRRHLNAVLDLSVIMENVYQTKFFLFLLVPCIFVTVVIS